MQTTETIYQLFSGWGEASAGRLILLLACQTGAVTASQLSGTGLLSSKKYCHRVLKSLCDKGYLTAHTNVIPSTFQRTKGSDLFVPTPKGMAYMEDFLFSGDPSPIHGNPDPERFSPDCKQLFHNTGVLDFFYGLLADWKEGSSFSVEEVIPDAPMRPDAIYRERTEGGGTHTFYIEEDTGTQREDALAGKFANYGAYFDKMLEKDTYGDRYLLDRTVAFHLNSIRATAGSLKPRPNPAAGLYRLSRTYEKAYGPDYYIPASEKKLTYLEKDCLPEGKDRYSKEDIKEGIRKAADKHGDFACQTVLNSAILYANKRKKVLASCTGMEHAWRYGAHTLALPYRYFMPLMPVCLPYLYGTLPDSFPSIGFPAGCEYHDTIWFQPGEGSSDLVAARGVLYNRKTNRYLIPENISHDLSGAYRAGIYLASPSFDSLLLLAEDLSEVEAFLAEHPPDRMEVYAMRYGDIHTGTGRIYRCTDGTPVPVKAGKTVNYPPLNI